MSKKIKKLIFVLYTIVPFTILIIFSVRAQASVEFNSAFDFNSIGFSKYESENPVEPGFHELDLYINDSYSGRSSVYVSGYDSKRKVYVEKKEIEKYGVKEKALEKASVVVIKEKEYVSPLDLDGAVKVDLDMASLAVRLSLPQIISINNPRGWVDQEYWDEGVTAALANYNANFYRNEFAGNVNESAFSSLRFGVNLGKWQYRNQSTLRWSETTGTEYQSTQNYIQRSIPEWQTSLQLGESYTNGRFLSSVPLLGATFKTDERMLPDSVRGYAPTVRGTAETNALVRISQDGRAIYETTVSPGAFEISDLFPTSYGGDLLVTIEESDGRTRTFTVPYAAVPNLLRPGRVKYSFALGTLNDTNLSANPMIVDGVYQRGLNNFLTGSVAGQAMKDYSAVGMGLAFNTPVGAIGFDSSYSYADIDGDVMEGWSAGATYSKRLNYTDTNFNVAMFRYSSESYLGIRDAAYLMEVASNGGYIPFYVDESINEKNSFQINVSQNFSGSANMFITSSVVDYWGVDNNNVNYQVGYGNQWRDVSYSVSASKTYSGITRDDEQLVSLSLSMPLGKSRNSGTVSLSASHSDKDENTYQGTYSATALEDRSLAYSVTASRAESEYSSTDAISGSVSKRTGVGAFSASASTSEGYDQYSVGASGSLLAHSGGVTLGQATGDTIALVEAEDAEGTRVNNGVNVRLNKRGYAIVPYMSPFRNNRIELDPKGSTDNVELKETIKNSAPYAGAVVKLEYKTESGIPAAFILSLAGGKVPIGATVYDASMEEVGVVGGGGQLILRDVKEGQRYSVEWNDNEQRCVFLVPVSESADDSLSTRVSRASCVPEVQ
ncbi:MAG: hypothetical protein CME41_07070 [Haliea sp.]|nr:hypothetical protein [Haliea sp.]|tara:strand:+ start:1742 stop:4249 length:2508 start_codon:yes stop_codon:yes gene_type:complete